MAEDTQILWAPSGKSLPSLGAKALVDISDGDTPNIRMPIRMLSIDTPEVTARSPSGAVRVDQRFTQLAEWLRQDIAPVTAGFRDYILPRLETGTAGTLQYTQGKSASEFHKQIVDRRLTRESTGTKRNLFIRSAEIPFDNYGRLLAYVAPSYSSREIRHMTREERATFNLNMVESGWAAPFVLFPSIPGELDLPIFLTAASHAMESQSGQYADELSLPGYEYRMCEKLYRITKKIVNGDTMSYSQRLAWRSRYCADMRDRNLYGPENYMTVPAPYRLWIWPDDVQRAIGMLNLVPVSLDN